MAILYLYLSGRGVEDDADDSILRVVTILATLFERHPIIGKGAACAYLHSPVVLAPQPVTTGVLELDILSPVLFAFN
jgi:hypothetical protein